MTPSSRLQTGVGSAIASPAYMWRVAAILLGIGATIGALALLAPHPEQFNDRALWTNVGVSYLIALICFLGANRFPTWPLHVILAASILAITRAAYDAGDPAGFYALFNVWIGLFAVFFFSRPAAIGYLLSIAGAYAWLLWPSTRQRGSRAGSPGSGPSRSAPS